MRLSQSKIGAWLHCPRSYKYQYVDGLEYATTPAMHLGTMVHQACAAVHEADLDDASDVLDELWARAPEDVRTDEKIAKNFLKAKDIWMPWYISEAQGQKTVDTEAYLKQPVNDNLEISGFLDRVYLDDGACVIADAKTGRNKPRYVENDLQLSIYAWLWQQNSGVLPARVEVWHLPSQTIVPAVRTEESLEAVIAEVVLPVANAISIGLFPPNSGHPFGCDFCSFRDICTVGRGAAQPEGGDGDE